MAWVECEYVVTLPDGVEPPVVEPTPEPTPSVAVVGDPLTIDGVPI
jgi:hypothetical protein